MAKLNIDFCLIDDSVVMHGFRAKMSGADLDSFKANPLLLFMHNRPSMSATTNTEFSMPIGKWYDIRVEDGKLLAKPEFDDDDELAVRVEKKVKKGYLNGASVWIDPLAISEDVADMLPGQSLPTFTQWQVLEASIVDIPNCKNALAIRNAAGKRITLSAESETDIKEFINSKFSKNNQMDKKFLCALLGLDENSTEDQIKAKINELKLAFEAKAGSAEQIKTLQDQIVALKLAADNKRNEDLVNAAIAEKKIFEGEKAEYLKLAAADFDTTSALLGKMQPAKSLQTEMQKKGEAADAEVAEMCKLSGRELYMNGKLETLKTLSPEHFKLKYKEAFGVEFKS